MKTIQKYFVIFSTSIHSLIHHFAIKVPGNGYPKADILSQCVWREKNPNKNVDGDDRLRFAHLVVVVSLRSVCMCVASDTVQLAEFVRLKWPNKSTF